MRDNELLFKAVLIKILFFCLINLWLIAYLTQLISISPSSFCLDPGMVYITILLLAILRFSSSYVHTKPVLPLSIFLQCTLDIIFWFHLTSFQLSSFFFHRNTLLKPNSAIASPFPWANKFPYSSSTSCLIFSFVTTIYTHLNVTVVITVSLNKGIKYNLQPFGPLYFPHHSVGKLVNELHGRSSKPRNCLH